MDKEDKKILSQNKGKVSFDRKISNKVGINEKLTSKINLNNRESNVQENKKQEEIKNKVEEKNILEKSIEAEKKRLYDKKIEEEKAYQNKKAEEERRFSDRQRQEKRKAEYEKQRENSRKEYEKKRNEIFGKKEYSYDPSNKLEKSLINKSKESIKENTLKKSTVSKSKEGNFSKNISSKINKADKFSKNNILITSGLVKGKPIKAKIIKDAQNKENFKRINEKLYRENKKIREAEILNEIKKKEDLKKYESERRNIHRENIKKSDTETKFSKKINSKIENKNLNSRRIYSKVKNNSKSNVNKNLKELFLKKKLIDKQLNKNENTSFSKNFNNEYIGNVPEGSKLSKIGKMGYLKLKDRALGQIDEDNNTVDSGIKATLYNAKKIKAFSKKSKVTARSIKSLIKTNGIKNKGKLIFEGSINRIKTGAINKKRQLGEGARDYLANGDQTIDSGTKSVVNAYEKQRDIRLARKYLTSKDKKSTENKIKSRVFNTKDKISNKRLNTRKIQSKNVKNNIIEKDLKDLQKDNLIRKEKIKWFRSNKEGKTLKNYFKNTTSKVSTFFKDIAIGVKNFFISSGGAKGAVIAILLIILLSILGLASLGGGGTTATSSIILIDDNQLQTYIDAYKEVKAQKDQEITDLYNNAMTSYDDVVLVGVNPGGYADINFKEFMAIMAVKLQQEFNLDASDQLNLNYDMSNIDLSKVSPKMGDFLKAALSMSGKPYVLGTSGPNSADCSGLVMYSGWQSGLLPKGYRTNVAGIASDRKHFIPISKSELRPGDLCIRMGTGKTNHVDIYTGDGKTFGARSPSRGIRDGILYSDNSEWRYSGYYRIIDPSVNVSDMGSSGREISSKENSRQGAGKKITVEATAYTPSPRENGGSNLTANGNRLEAYKYIAVDPKVIPLGTKIYIPFFKDYPNKGVFIADDTGGAIKGNRIDVLLANSKEANRFGRRNIDIYVDGKAGISGVYSQREVKKGNKEFEYMKELLDMMLSYRTEESTYYVPEVRYGQRGERYTVQVPKRRLTIIGETKYYNDLKNEPNKSKFKDWLKNGLIYGDKEFKDDLEWIDNLLEVDSIQEQANRLGINLPDGSGEFSELTGGFTGTPGASLTAEQIAKFGGKMISPNGSRNPRISSKYGYRIHPVYGTKKFHTGIDIPGANGSPIYSAKAGTVIFAGTKGNGYGNYVVVDHGNGITTLYAHCSNVNVRIGDRVQAGDNIANIGSTGVSTGPHIHFEVRINGKHTDPTQFL